MSLPAEFEARIAGLDLSLFAAIDSQSDDGDRRSWLALQRLVRRWNGSYTYLEIGSYLGGSIQPHLLDPRCRKILSIDNRPAGELPDDRGQGFRYADNSTARMLANLRAVDAGQVAKVISFEADARGVDPARLPDRPDLCFIDGEHTRSAVMSDFELCARVCADRAIIYFHDDWVVYPALAQILRQLGKQGRRFTVFKLLGSTFAIGLGDSDIAADDFLREVAVDGRRFIRRQRVRRFLRQIVQRIVPAPLRPAARWLRRLFRGVEVMRWN
ncbi:MAG: class I SAM-dependent methyltransferase [Thermoanaerobaculia bacterium]